MAGWWEVPTAEVTSRGNLRCERGRNVLETLPHCLENKSHGEICGILDRAMVVSTALSENFGES